MDHVYIPTRGLVLVDEAIAPIVRQLTYQVEIYRRAGHNDRAALISRILDRTIEGRSEVVPGTEPRQAVALAR
jgi:hypothetical protein